MVKQRRVPGTVPLADRSVTISAQAADRLLAGMEMLLELYRPPGTNLMAAFLRQEFAQATAQLREALR